MPSLWSPPNWPQRLAELQAPTGELKEAPLRRDVRSLGMLLGEVLREQAGVPIFEAVEELRQTAIAHRESASPAATPNAPSSTRTAGSRPRATPAADPLPHARTLRRHAPTGRHRASTHHTPEGAADGRAVRRPGCADTRP